jgi:DtxR family Mn-dependent transcriptional regulator
MEHTVSPVTLEAFVSFMEFIEACPRGGATWLEYFDEYKAHGQPKDTCLERMKRFAREYDARIKEIQIGNTEGEV